MKAQSRCDIAFRGILVFIQGHSPAGGCLLAMCCDYRIMAPNFTIGLNETQLVSVDI